MARIASYREMSVRKVACCQDVAKRGDPVMWLLVSKLRVMRLVKIRWTCLAPRQLSCGRNKANRLKLRFSPLSEDVSKKRSVPKSLTLARHRSAGQLFWLLCLEAYGCVR